MKKIFILLLWFAVASHSYAQDAVNQPLLDYFQNMDMYQVNTGILKERGFPVFDMDFFNGQTLTDTNRLDANRFGWIYMQLMLGNVNEKSNLPDPQVYMNQYINEYTGTGTIPIAIANYRYNYIKSTAIDQNLVYVSNGQMYGTPNLINSPYGEARLFAATTLALKSNQANTSFSVPSNLYLTNQSMSSDLVLPNQTATLQTLEIDLGDGQGYRTISLGQNFSTQYSSNGVKTIKIKATLANGTVLMSHTSLELNDPSLISTPDSPPTSYNEKPDQTVNAVIQMGNSFPSAKLNIFYHCPNRGLQKPLIFIEGFNPSELQNQTYEAMKTRLKDFLNISTSSPPMWQRLYDEGYDLIYVDFDDGAGDIVTNAQVVKRAIHLVNEMKHAAGSSEKTKVMGASMGGVVGKWALREMEIAGEAHEVDQYTSIDAPLKGANVPLGIQHMIKDLATRNGKVVIKTFFGSITLKSFSIGEFIPLIQTVKTVFNKPATKQMLFYNAWADESNPRQFHDAFYSQFEALGDLQQIEHIKVSNGSSIGQTQLLNAGELYATVTGFGTTPVRTGIGRTSIDVTVALDLKIFAIPASGNGTIYGGNILLSVPGGATVVMPNPIVKTASGLKPFDSAPGGFENFGFPFIAGALSFDRVIISADFGTKTNGLWGFIPTFSSLGITEPSDVNAPLTGCGSSSGDGCIASNSAASQSIDVLINGGFAHNQGHVTINQRNYDFILSKLHTNFIDFNAPNGILTRTFNYGKSNEPSNIPRLRETVNLINRSVTVQNTGSIWVNRNNRIGFIDENNLQNQTNALFDLRITGGIDNCVAANATVILQNGGSMQLGDPSVNNTAKVHIDAGGILNVKQNGTLSIENNAQLIVESGGRLIIEAGANINLVGSDSKIIIKSGGQLIFNGQPIVTGNGHFLFEQGNIFTLNSNLILTGAGRTNPLIKIAADATVVVNNPFEWTITNGAVVHEAGVPTSQRYIWLKNGATFKANNVLFNDLYTPLFGPITASFVVVEDPSDLNNDPDDVDYSFVNCIFQNTGIAVDLDVPYAQSDPFDWRNVNVEFKNSTFSNCQAIKADRSYITLLEDCTLTNANIDMSHTYWLNVKNTTIRSNLFGPTDENYASFGYGIKATHVGHFWFRENSLIDGWGTGIDASSGLNWNIIMTDQSTIQRCATAIHLNGTKYNQSVDLGLLHMDCGRLIKNAASIKGQDIIFSAYTRNGTTNLFTPNINNPSGLFIESIFQNRFDTELWLHGNYWNGTTPATTPVNSAWSFLTRYNFPQPAIPWVGTIHINPDLRTSEFDPAVQGCGGVNLRGVHDDPLGKKTIVKINGVLYDVKKQYDAALRIFKKDKFKDALNTFRPIAQIPRSIRDTASATVKHFVDMAQALTLDMGVQTRSVSSSGWLPESIVGIVKPENSLVLSPNPANEQFDIILPNGNYDIQVFDALGKRVFSKNTEGVTTVDVRTWQNGIYMVSLLDKNSKKKTFSKVVVQH